MVAHVLMQVWSTSTPNRTMSITTRRTALLFEIELCRTVTVEPVMYAPPPWVASGGHTSEGGLCVDATMSDLRCLCQLKCHANTRLCTHGSVVRKWFVKVSRPASVYLHAVRETSPNRTCASTQVAVADVAPTSAPRHAARVRTWLKGATEWVGGWGVRMSEWVGVAATV